MTTTKKLRFGSNVAPHTARAVWGARLIVTHGFVDFVYDRQDCYGEDTNELLDRLNQGLVEVLKERVGELLGWHAGMRPDRAEDFILYDEDGLVMHGNTNASYGYCYVSAWLEGTTS